MNDAKQINFAPLRVILIVTGLFGLGLLTTAGILKPDSDGYGTHQQLGLPHCGVLAWYGRPCPSCGMTTSWSNLMRGNFGDSLQANPAGAWLGSWTLLLSVWAVGSAAVGRWLLVRPNQWFFLCLVTSTLLFILTVWVIRFFF